MNDWVRLEGLVLSAPVGWYGWEKLGARPLVLDIELAVDLRRAGVSDDLADTINYQAVADTAAEVARTHHHALVEAYADHLAQCLFATYPCTALKLTVHKPGAVAGTRTLSVHIERRRADYPDAGHSSR
ncbi:MAG TPA: dihydroneopterin aldolase [Nevskiaceae bacterium]|nr:dihydroneopterin aldolase [Nevskiaceae bacterium]